MNDRDGLVTSCNNGINDFIMRFTSLVYTLSLLIEINSIIIKIHFIINMENLESEYPQIREWNQEDRLMMQSKPYLHMLGSQQFRSRQGVFWVWHNDFGDPAVEENKIEGR